MMRLGTTSYIYHADIITNIRKLAGRVQDIELVLFEADDENNLPDRPVIEELKRIASDHGMSYTVHLPLDLRLAACNRAASVQKALRVIRSTEDLSPLGFIVHLEDENQNVGLDSPRWLDNSVIALEHLGGEIGDSSMLCPENLENHSPLLLHRLLERVPVSCCVDVGHLWKQGLDPVSHLEQWLPRARIVHIHGIGTRDHESISSVSAEKLDPVVGLLDGGFRGVLTFEVFSEADLRDSLEAFGRSLERVRARASTKKPEERSPGL